MKVLWISVFLIALGVSMVLEFTGREEFIGGLIGMALIITGLTIPVILFIIKK